jgi:hypothetical protein
MKLLVQPQDNVKEELTQQQRASSGEHLGVNKTLDEVIKVVLLY